MLGIVNWKCFIIFKIRNIICFIGLIKLFFGLYIKSKFVLVCIIYDDIIFKGLKKKINDI